MKPTTFALISCIVAIQVFAAPCARAADGEPFYAQKERGWFWREPEPDSDEVQPLKPPPPPAKAQPQAPAPAPAVATPPPPAPFSTKWFKENLDKYREQAIDNPTKENVTAYIALQRVMLDKASKFADTWQDVILQDTDFNESKRRPSSTAGATALDQQARESRENVAKAVSERVGIWFFFRSDCKPCNVQFTALQGLAERYKFTVLPISLDGRPLPNVRMKNFARDHGQAVRMGVNTLPTTFAVLPPNNFTKLTEWVASTDELIERILRTSRTLGLLDDSTFATTKPVNDRNLPSDIGSSIDSKTLDDKAALSEFIRNEVRKNSRN